MLLENTYKRWTWLCCIHTLTNLQCLLELNRPAMSPILHALDNLDARDYSDTHSDTSLYNYTPTESYCIAYVVVFSLIGIVHCLQAYRARLWIAYPTLVAGVLTEVLGWSARLWSSRNVLLLTPFLMQIST